MGLLVVVLVFTLLLKQAHENAKTDQELARQGIVSPRLQAKYGDGAREKTARYGFWGFFADAWSDGWANRTEARRAAHEAAKTAVPVAGRKKVRWRDRLRAAGRAANTVVRKVRASTRPTPQVEGQREPASRSDTTPMVNDTLDVNEVADLFKDDLDDEGLALVRQRRCCWPVAARPDGRWVYCGDPAADGFVYCDPHMDEADREQPSPDQKPDRTADASTDKNDDNYRPKHSEPDPIDNGGKTVSAPTGEAVNYETTIAELEKLAEEQRKHLEATQQCELKVGEAKAALDGMQQSYRASSQAAATLLDFLASKSLDGTTLGLVGTTAEAMPASKVDELYDHLEVVEQEAKERKEAAAAALESTEAAIRHLQAEYGDLADGVATKLGGDASFVDSTGGRATVGAAA